MRGHLDAEALAMCREGLLGRRAAARIRAHLSGCSRCAEVDAGLADVPSLLALTSMPPMPAELAARIGAALAAEAAGRPSEAARAAEDVHATPGAHTAAQGALGATSAVPGAAPGQEVRSPEEVRSPAPGGRTLRGRPGLARKVLACAAAIAVVAAGGGYLLSRRHSTSESSASSAAAPSTAEGPAARAGPPNAAAGSGAGGITAISSGTNYRPGQLTTQVAAVLARQATPAAGTSAAVPSAKAPTSEVPARPVTSAALKACVARIAAGLPPRLVDKARYDGRAATIIVLPASARGPGQVWVVGPACSGTRSDVVAHAPLPGSG